MTEPTKTPAELTPPSELEVRALRDAVYGESSTDSNWDGCRDHWMKPEETKRLREWYAAMKK